MYKKEMKDKGLKDSKHFMKKEIERGFA